VKAKNDDIGALKYGQ